MARYRTQLFAPIDGRGTGAFAETLDETRNRWLSIGTTNVYSTYNSAVKARSAAEHICRKHAAIKGETEIEIEKV